MVTSGEAPVRGVRESSARGVGLPTSRIAVMPHASQMQGLAVVLFVLLAASLYVSARKKLKQ